MSSNHREQEVQRKKEIDALNQYRQEALERSLRRIENIKGKIKALSEREGGKQTQGERDQSSPLAKK